MNKKSGVIVLVLIGFLALLIYVLSNNSSDSSGVIIGDRIENAQQKNEAIQAVDFDNPISIYNSENYLVNIGVSEYKKAKNRLLSSDNYLYKGNYSSTINLIFLNKEYNVIRRLLDKPASISKFYIPSPTSGDEIPNEAVENILFEIALEDTDNNQRINYNDDHDLYISDLDGDNLKRVTSGFEVENFEFINDFSQILIRLKDRKAEREEYKKSKLVIYDIASEKIRELNSLNQELLKIEKQLNTVD